jgi:hypothetical protein
VFLVACMRGLGQTLEMQGCVFGSMDPLGLAPGSSDAAISDVVAYEY